MIPITKLSSDYRNLPNALAMKFINIQTGYKLKRKTTTTTTMPLLWYRGITLFCSSDWSSVSYDEPFYPDASGLFQDDVHMARGLSECFDKNIFRKNGFNCSSTVPENLLESVPRWPNTLLRHFVLFLFVLCILTALKVSTCLGFLFMSITRCDHSYDSLRKQDKHTVIICGLQKRKRGSVWIHNQFHANWKL